MARGHRLNTSIVPGAVHGLSGLFRAVSAVEPSLSRPLPLLSPSLISHLASADVKQNVLVLKMKLNESGRHRAQRARASRLSFSFLNQALGVLNRIVQELCESRGGRPGLSVLTSLLVSVDVKNY